MSRPSPARLYDYWLGGLRAREADRELAAQLEEGCPELPALVATNRRFVLKAVTWCAARGIRQFLDLGCGFPGGEQVHEAARKARPGAVTAYVDINPFVIAHLQAATRDDKGVVAVEADVSRPAAAFSCPQVTSLIDVAQPVAVIFGTTLSAMPGNVAGDALAGYAGALEPSSAVIVSCISYADEETAARQAKLFTGATGQPWYNHDAATMESWLAAAWLDPIRSTVCDVTTWPLLPPLRKQAEVSVIGAVALKRT